MDVFSLKCITAFTTDSASQLDVLWHDGNWFRMDSAQVGVFNKAN